MERLKGGITRREFIGASSIAISSLFFGSSESVNAQQKNPQCIDVHAHLWPDEYLKVFANYGGKKMSLRRELSSGVTEPEIEKRLALMDAAGVDLQVLSVAPYVPHFEDRAHAKIAARKINDLQAEVVRRWPKRFAAFAALPLPHVDESLEEIDRAIGQLGMFGAVLTTDILGRSVADPGFSPVYEELHRRKSVAFLHPSGSGILSPLISDYKITSMVGAPTEVTVAIVHLMMQGIPGHFSNLKIIAAHLGGALPILIERLDNTFPSEYPPMPEKPSLAARRLWYDTASYADETALRAAVEAFGSDRLVLGGDFPYADGTSYERNITYIEDAGWKDATAAGILRQNASGLFGLA